MGRAIIKINDLYFEWSTVVDAPVTYGMSLDQLRAYVKEETGRQGLEQLERDLSGIDKTGSQYHYTSLKEVISSNRAGPKERKLTKQQIYDTYSKPSQP